MSGQVIMLSTTGDKMKDIPGYEGLYAITEQGKVWSHIKQKFLSEDKTYSKGDIKKINHYCRVTLTKGPKHHKKFLVHQLMAKTYLLNYSEKLVVNHKNEIKSDNRLENLEMVSHGLNKLLSSKTAGYYEDGGKWKAQIFRINLGRFETELEAKLRYKKAKKIAVRYLRALEEIEHV